jgi:hypothetical protein
MSLPYPPPYQDIQTLSKHVCMSERTIEEQVRRGLFPPHKKVQGAKKLWKWKEVEAYLDGGMQSETDRIKEATRAASNQG